MPETSAVPEAASAGQLGAMRRWLVLVLVSLAFLMVELDITIVNVALPSIRQDLGFSRSDLQWVINAYLLLFGGFVLLAGRAADLFASRCSRPESRSSASAPPSARSPRRRLLWWRAAPCRAWARRRWPRPGCHC